MQISVCGCGWLGLPLAQQLQQSGHNIVATCRSSEKQQELSKLGFTSLVFNLGDELKNPALQDLFQSQILILNVPPGGRAIQPEFYLTQMTRLIEHAFAQGVQQLIFVSTTAVYGNQQSVVNEQSPTAPVTPSALAHVAIEQNMMQTFGPQGCILRLAGLVGPNRHPAKHLAGKTDLANGQQAVNLIHQQDVIRTIEHIIEQQKFGQTFHLSSHQHPSRKEYYCWAAQQLGLPEPKFLPDENGTSGKKTDASWTCNELGLELNYPSPFDML